METYTNLNGDECIIIENEDGTTWSGLKSAWDEMQEVKENNGGLN